MTARAEQKQEPGRDRSESRWPPAFAVLSALLLYLLLPPHLTLGPRWLMPLLVLGLLVPLLLSGPVRAQESPMRRRVGIVLIAIVNAANITSLALLVYTIVTAGSKEKGWELLLSAAAIWVTNILVFALWYWEIDRGGPQRRLSVSPRFADFQFPQMMTPRNAPEGWLPTFPDYLYLAFTNSTAFSPADVMPLTPSAKALMTVEALVSLTTIVVVFSRAVSIIT